MMLVLQATALLCACAHYASGLGLYGVGLPIGIKGGLGGLGHGLGLGLSKGGRDSDHYDEVLTCRNVELTATNTIAFAVTVTVKSDSSSSSSKGGTGPYGMWDLGMMMGGYGWGGGVGGGGRRRRGGLTASIELVNNIQGGTGLVAFTTRAQPENLCALDGTGNFGPNLTPNDDDDYYGGYGGGYHDLLYGGYGGWGRGLSHWGGLSPYDYDDLDDSNDNGVIAEVPITQGTVTTLTVDGLPFDDLSDLAGRGVVICSGVVSDNGDDYVCQKPFFACCQLRYDEHGETLDGHYD